MLLLPGLVHPVGYPSAGGQTPPFSEATSKVGLIRQFSLHPAASCRRHVPCASGGRWTLTVVSLVPRAPASGPTPQRVSHLDCQPQSPFLPLGKEVLCDLHLPYTHTLRVDQKTQGASGLVLMESSWDPVARSSLRWVSCNPKPPPHLCFWTAPTPGALTISGASPHGS